MQDRHVTQDGIGRLSELPTCNSNFAILRLKASGRFVGST
jgi:hypothetical protein